jgi:hypothetical protein
MVEWRQEKVRLIQKEACEKIRQAIREDGIEDIDEILMGT